MAKTETSASDDDIVREVKTFIQDSEAAHSEERDHFIDDLNFLYDEDGQWDKATLTQRVGRPSYTFNRVLGAVNQVIGEQRMFKPSIRVRGVDDDSDQDLAEVFGGLIRNIEAISDAESIYDNAFKYAASGGYGAWRIVTDYQNERSFEQEICIKDVYNPLTVDFDPLCADPVKRGQNKCSISEWIPHEIYESMYDDEGGVSIMKTRDNNWWINEKAVRVAEFFKREPIKKTIALMSDGRVVDYDEVKDVEEDLAQSEGAATVVKTRTVDTYQVKWWKVSGNKVLEGPITYNWKHIPVVKLPGRYINIEGKQKTQSLIRHAKDPQKVYNYNRTTQSETAANAPRQPYLVTPAMIKGYENQWNNSGARNSPYLMYNPDPKAPAGAQAPQRVKVGEVPDALISMSAQDVDDIKQATGFFDASLGRQGNEISGSAIKNRQRQADIGSYEFYDNLKKAIKFTGDILVDMIPKVYDTERTVRILGLDGQEDFRKINAFDEQAKKKIDLSKGSYDVTVDIGPTFSTQREESFNTLIEAAGVMPVVAELAPDLIMKNLDVPGSDELVKRLRMYLISKGTIEPNEDEQEDIKPPAPDPVQQALVQSEEAKAQKNFADAINKMVEAAETIKNSDLNTRNLQAEGLSNAIQTLQGMKQPNG